MRVTVRTDKCFSYANCISALPSMFEPGKDDKSTVKRPVGPDDDVESVIRVVSDCPMQALALVDDDDQQVYP